MIRNYMNGYKTGINYFALSLFYISGFLRGPMGNFEVEGRQGKLLAVNV